MMKQIFRTTDKNNMCKKRNIFIENSFYRKQFLLFFSSQ